MTTFTVATYNIHKGVQGLALARRLEIHNLGHAVEMLDADVVCLQEVRGFNHQQAKRFQHWPPMGQAEFLAPLGYESVYRTNAVTLHGEHGNALLSRWPVLTHGHENMSDHRFEQRGLLHVTLQVQGRELHVIVVHLGLLPASRVRQIEQLQRYIVRHVPPNQALVVAGDFNDWGRTITRLMTDFGCQAPPTQALATFPSRLPLAQLDHVYVRGLHLVNQFVPKGRYWARLSDHLPLVVTLAWEPT